LGGDVFGDELGVHIGSFDFHYADGHFDIFVFDYFFDFAFDDFNALTCFAD
jgi:hypothetical protein